MEIRSIVLIILSLLVFGSSSFAANWLDPNLKWKTIETKHFSIHYHTEIESVAKQLAPIAEETHRKLSKFLQWEVAGKTQVMLVDTADMGNGWASVFPDPRITLFLTDWSSNLNASKFDDWLKFVFTHEYTHILHLDIVDGYPALLRMIFGTVIAPNAIEPAFLIEGLAVYAETKNNQWGRAKDPEFEMMLRMDVLEGNVRSAGQAALNTVGWPMGNLRYLYGSHFLKYLADIYGEERLADFAHVYGQAFYSFGIDGAFFIVYGKPMGLLWREWLEQEEEKAEKFAAAAGETIITKPELLTYSGYINLKAKWSKDGKAIYWQANNTDEYSGIRVKGLGDSREKTIYEGSVYSDNLTLNPAGDKLLFSKTDLHKWFYLYSDLFVLDLKTGQATKLTQGERLADADWSPDGKSIVAVKNELGTRSLMILNADGANIRPLVKYQPEVQFFGPRFSPDGKKVAVVKWLSRTAGKIYLVDVESETVEKLTTDDGLISESSPAFTPDGKYIIFSSDRSGAMNLYAYDLAAQKQYQLTNMMGGAFMPDVSPDGKKIVYSSYSAKGYDLATLDFSLPKAPVAPTKAQPSPEPKASADPAVKYSIHDYDPLPSLMPKFWVPSSYANENGAQTYINTLGFDVLGQHYYYLQLGYDAQSERLQYGLTYVNNQFLPQISVSLADSAVGYGGTAGTLWMREQKQSLGLSVTQRRLLNEWDSQTFSFGFQRTNISNIDSLTAEATPPSLGNIQGLFAGWGYSNARSYAKSVCPEQGYSLSLGVGLNSTTLGSDYSYTTYSGSAAHYFSAPFDHQVLVPTFSGFYAKGDRLTQANYTWQNLSLRGYPSSVVSGNKGATLSSEYRFPVAYPEFGPYYGMFFLDRIAGTLFYDVGGATFGPIADLPLKKSYGWELDFNTAYLWAYYVINIKLGWAKGVDAGGTAGYYYSIGI